MAKKGLNVNKRNFYRLANNFVLDFPSIDNVEYKPRTLKKEGKPGTLHRLEWSDEKYDHTLLLRGRRGSYSLVQIDTLRGTICTFSSVYPVDDSLMCKYRLLREVA